MSSFVHSMPLSVRDVHEDPFVFMPHPFTFFPILDESLRHLEWYPLFIRFMFMVVGLVVFYSFFLSPEDWVRSRTFSPQNLGSIFHCLTLDVGSGIDPVPLAYARCGRSACSQ